MNHSARHTEDLIFDRVVSRLPKTFSVPARADDGSADALLRRLVFDMQDYDDIATALFPFHREDVPDSACDASVGETVAETSVDLDLNSHTHP